MSDIIKVTGQECLNYIDRALCFGNRERDGTPALPYPDLAVSVESLNDFLKSLPTIATRLLCFNHDTNKRKVGYVRKKYEDGGLEVCILGNETLSSWGRDGFRSLEHRIQLYSYQKYSYNVVTMKTERDDDPPYPTLPAYEQAGGLEETSAKVGVYKNVIDGDSVVERFVPFDEAIAFLGELITSNSGNLGAVWQYQGQSIVNRYDFDLSDDPFNTLVFGIGSNTNIRIDKAAINDPLTLCGGNLYAYGTHLSADFHAQTPAWFDSDQAYDDYFSSTGILCHNYNLVSIPYNLVLTDNIDYAHAYLSRGVLPPDAYLYPLDLDNLPIYNEPDDDGDDGEDDNTPDDNSRDITPNLPVAPTFTPSMLSNYNWYWLTAPQMQAFINWFWNDVGTINDFSDLVEKIEGLYNDLASAVLMVRYFPVDNDATWIGGKEATTSIKLGMIEQSANVDQLKTTVVPSVREIGNVHIPNKYNSFVDLSPYSALSLYLPFHGFVDMDMNLFSGHDLYVKGVYDHLTGTLQYLIYLDNQFLVNSFVVKMAVDIPITLQSKNDRDSAIFNNLTSSVGGLLGAGATLATGNPIGLVVGAQSMNSGVNSAPLNVRGTVGETGAFYAPPQCAIILRRPTISKPSEDIWKRNIGQICGQSYTLSNLRGKGYTKVYNPRITFTSNPLQSEIDEIYDFLTEGVIL